MCRVLYAYIVVDSDILQLPVVSLLVGYSYYPCDNIYVTQATLHARECTNLGAIRNETKQKW